jgi:hypothetical protein
VQASPNRTFQVLAAGTIVALLVLIVSLFTGIFIVSTTSPLPSGLAVESDLFLPGPYLANQWACPRGFSCPALGFVPYTQLPPTTNLPPLPRTGLLYSLGLIAFLSAILAVALALRAQIRHRRQGSLTMARTSVRWFLFGSLVTLLTPIALFALTPLIISDDMTQSSSGLPGSPGPWSSWFGSDELGHVTLSWGPSIGFYLALISGVTLLALPLWARWTMEKNARQ